MIKLNNTDNMLDELFEQTRAIKEIINSGKTKKKKQKDEDKEEFKNRHGAMVEQVKKIEDQVRSLEKRVEKNQGKDDSRS